MLKLFNTATHSKEEFKMDSDIMAETDSNKDAMSGLTEN